MSNKKVILCFHDMTGTPNEWKSLTVSLEKFYPDTYTLFCPRLPGHQSVEEIGSISWIGWYQFVNDTVSELHKKFPHEELIIIGQSFGALLALLANYRCKDLSINSRLILLAPPWKLNRYSLFLRIMSLIPDYLLPNLGTIPKSKRVSAIFPLGRSSFDRHSISGGIRVEKMKRYLKKIKKHTFSKTLLIYDPYDHMVHQDAIRLMIQDISFLSLSLVPLPEAQHEISYGPRHQEVSDIILSFIYFV